MRFWIALIAVLNVWLAAADPHHPWGVANAAPSASPLDQQQEIRRVAQLYERKPVDARLDRVWHAIPGLNGWQLDVAKSLAATQEWHDGNLHLVWVSQAPAVRLGNLPAEPVYRGPDAERSVCLMFNVAWGEQYLPDVLKVLAAEGVRATFFLDGDFIRKHRDLARRIVEGGHAVGSHGTGHPDYRRLPEAALERNIIHTNSIISHTLGVTPILLAPPAGSYDQRTVRLARQHGMYIVLWTVDTVDWRRPSPAVIVQRVVSGATPGALVLMHPTQPTVAALPELIQGLKRQGYRFKTVEQLVREETADQPPATLSAHT